jgi:hypothetical protein
MKLNTEDTIDVFHCISDDIENWEDFLLSIDIFLMIRRGHEFATTYDVLVALGFDEDEIMGASLLPISRDQAVKVVNKMVVDNGILHNVNWKNVYKMTGVPTNPRHLLESLGLTDDEIDLKKLIPDMNK